MLILEEYIEAYMGHGWYILMFLFLFIIIVLISFWAVAA